MLLNILLDKGVEVTQATLSRDMRELKIAKIPMANGSSIYRQALRTEVAEKESPSVISAHGFIRIDFSGQLAVVKTRPGYAMGIAAEIDAKSSGTILGTVAGDDTILVIPKENISKEEILGSLSRFLPI